MTDDTLLKQVQSLQSSGDMNALCDLYAIASEPQRELIRDALLLIHSGAISQGPRNPITPKHRWGTARRGLSPRAHRPEVFRDTGHSIYSYFDQILVECRKCRRKAEVRHRPNDNHACRFVCEKCGATMKKTGRNPGVSPRIPRDPCFGKPLWLQIPCCGEILWAYNSRHLNVLERFIAASVRENASWTNGFVQRLPAWIKVGKNREKLLAGIARLKKRLGD